MLIGIEAAHANKEKRTGVENVCFALIQELKKQIPSSVRVILYSNARLRGELGELPDNWREKILSWPFKKLWSQLRLSWELLFHPPDIFFAPGQLVPFFCPKKTISIIHDSAFLVYPEAYNFWGRQYLKWMNKRVVKKSWKIITSSEFNKCEIRKYYGERAAEKTVVVPFAYDHSKYKQLDFGQNGLCLMQEATNNIHGLFIMSVGRLEKKKNTVNIVRAFNWLKSTNNSQHPVRDLQLLLVGHPGVGYTEVAEEIDKSPYKQDIILLGWVGSGTVPYLLNKAKAFIFPSLYEGFGLPVLEAMACGCPVIASDIPALREVGGEAAIYYQNAEDAASLAKNIIEILRDDALRKNKIQAGLERVQSFVWVKTAKKIMDLF